MKKKTLKKIIAVFLSFVMAVGILGQNIIPVQGTSEVVSQDFTFGESAYVLQKQSVTIKNLFQVTDVKVNSGKVTYQVQGDNVQLVLNEGTPSRIGPHQMNATFILEQDIDIFPSSIDYKKDGYVGILTQSGSSIFQGGMYTQCYKGTVTNPAKEFYQYKVTISYTENQVPGMNVVLPKDGQRLKDGIRVQGTVKDENVGDELTVLYSVDPANNTTTGSALGAVIIADGTDQSFQGLVNVMNLSEGVHNLSLWVKDRKGAESARVSIPFTIDITPPGDPVISQVPGNETPTNGDVKVKVDFPLDAVEKDYRIGSTGPWITYPDTGIDISVNDAVYAVCKDEAGNSSGEPFIVITNIDKTSPETPVLKADPTGFTNKDVIVTITYPQDASTKEYRINGSDWKTFPDTNLTETVTLDSNGTVEARAKDQAGNVSPVSTLLVDNIDIVPPEAPKIVASADTTVAVPITVTIYPGVDKKSGVNRTEYSLKGAVDSSWKEYTDPFIVTAIGDTEISARTIDNMGNVSDISTKKITISKAVVVTATPAVILPPAVNPPVNSTSPAPAVTASPTPARTTEPVSTQPGGGNGVFKADPAVFISSDQQTYEENEVVIFTINYKNKTNVPLEKVVIKAQIPQYTTLFDAAGGNVDKNNITWNIDKLKENESGSIQYKVKVNSLDTSEVSVTDTASITCSNTVINPDDDTSVYRFLAYSNRFKDNFHKKYVVGYKDKTFRPENNITRAEVAAMMASILNLEKASPDQKNYPDVDKNHWANRYIYATSKAGLFTGYTDGTFRPDSYITRAEMAVVLAKYLKLKNVEPIKLDFNDIGNHWAKNYIEEIYRNKIIEGYIDGDSKKYMPDAKIRRSETVSILNRVLYRGPLKGVESVFTDVKSDHWAYGHILESSLDHYYVRNKDNSETKVNNK